MGYTYNEWERGLNIGAFEDGPKTENESKMNKLI